MTDLRVEIRDKRLRSGRMSLSARTTSKVVRRKREALVRVLLDRGDLETIERLRSREIHWTDVERAARTDDYDSLRKPVSSLTLGELLQRVQEIVDATKAKGTARQYQVVGRLLIAEFGADFDPATLTMEAARSFLHRPRPRRGRDGLGPWSPRRQNQVVALAGRIWREAIAYDADAAKKTNTRPRLTENAWRQVETPEIRPTRNAFLRPQEWRTLARRVEGQPVAAALGLACLAGLRQSEIRYLRTDIDIDLDARRIHVQQRGGEHPWRPKTARGTRDLRISDELLAILRSHVSHGYAGPRYFLRTAHTDHPITHTTLTRWVQEAFTEAGIAYGREGDSLTLHSLRHTFASWLVQADVQLKKVADLMGDRPEMVDRVYGHLLPGDLDQAIDLVGEIAAVSSRPSAKAVTA